MKTPPDPATSLGVRGYKRFANGVERVVTTEGDVWRKRPIEGEYITLANGVQLQIHQWDHLGRVAVPKYHRTAHKSIRALQEKLARVTTERDEALAQLVYARLALGDHGEP